MMKIIWILISIFIFIISIQGVDADTVISYGDGWTHYIYDDENHAHKLAPNNYLRWDGEWLPKSEINFSSGDWPYLVEEFDDYYFITRLDDNLYLSKNYRTYNFQPHKIGVTLTTNPAQLNQISTYHNVAGTDYWYIVIPQSLKETVKELYWDNKLPIISNESGFVLNQSDNNSGMWIPNYEYKNVGGELRLYYNQTARSFGIDSTEVTFDFNSYIINSSTGWANTSYSSFAYDRNTGNLILPDNVTNGLVLYHKMSGSSGITSYDMNLTSDNNGTLTNMNNGLDNGSSGWNSTGFGYGNVISFDGINDYVDCGNDISITDNTVGTITIRVNFNTLTVDSCLLGYGGDNTATPGVFYFGVRDSGVSDYRLYILTQIEGSGGWDIVYGNTTITAGNDYHLSVSSNGSAWSLYVNGSKETLSIKQGANSGEWIGDVNPGGLDILTIGNRKYDGVFDDYIGGLIDDVRIFNLKLTNDEINETLINTMVQSDNVTHWHDAGTGYQTASFIVNMTTPTNTDYTVWYADNGSSFIQIGGIYTGNQTPSIIGTKYQNTDLRIVMNGNSTATPEEIEVIFVTETSLLPPQNITNVTEQTQICYNWDDYVSADYWNISQRIPSIPYTDVKIVLDGVKDAEFTDRAHTWVLDPPHPTGSNGDKELISWIRNATTLSGYADGEDDDALNNDDSFKIMLDMTANNLSTDDRQFILSESGTVTAKRWGGAAWLPQATNAVGVVIGAGVAGSIQYEMQIPISELTNFNNGSTIKLAMERKDTSQNPDVIKYYPKTLINDTDATKWISINLTAESEYTFLGNTTLSNYTVTGLTPFTWYRHRFSTINGSSESSYVYSNDITEDSSQYTVSGYILTEADLPISGATVWSVCDCGCVCEVKTSNATGYYQGDCFYNGTYTIYAIATGYLENSRVVIVNGANRSNQNITLTLTPSITISPAPPVQYDEFDLPLLLYIFIISLLYICVVFRNGVAATELSMIYLLFIFFMLLFQTISLSVNYIYIPAFIFLFQISITGINLERKGGD